MVIGILETVLIVVALYALLPFVWTRLLGFGVLRRTSGNASSLALTFDDGPHPDYTPQVLDLLQEHGVKATFFIIGTMAEQHKDLIVRMHEEGHAIGIHGYRHQLHWLKAPWAIARDVERTADLIQEITGVRPHLFRPPWGVFNLFDAFSLRRFRGVLWSCMVGDWRRQEPNVLLHRLQKGIRPGSVIVLHDSDVTFGAQQGAPLMMVQTLQRLFEEGVARSLTWARVDELEQGEVRRLTKAWLAWERLFQRLYHVEKLQSDDDFLLIRPKQYTGKQQIELDDGTVLQHGDAIVEIHLNNERLLYLHGQARSDMHFAKLMLQEMRAMLRLIAHYLDHPDRASIKALYGISLIHRGAEALGFHTLSMSRGVFSFATKLYLKVLLSALHPKGQARLKQRSALLVPQQVVFSRTELLTRYTKHTANPVKATHTAHAASMEDLASHPQLV